MSLLRRYFMLAVLAAVLGGGVAYLAMTGPDRYVARTDVLIGPIDASERAIFLEQPERYVASQTAVATSLRTARAATGAVEGASLEEVQSAVTATAITNANVVRIAVRADDARSAELLARAVVDAFVGEGQDRLGQSLGVELDTQGQSTVLLGFATLVGAMLGVFLMLIATQLLQRLSPRLLDIDELEPELRARVLGGQPLRLRSTTARAGRRSRRPSRSSASGGSVDRLAVELALRSPKGARIGVAGISPDSGADLLVRQLAEAMEADGYAFSTVAADAVGAGGATCQPMAEGALLVDATATSPLRLVALLDELDVLVMVGRLRRDRKTAVEQRLTPLLQARPEVWSVWLS